MTIFIFNGIIVGRIHAHSPRAAKLLIKSSTLEMFRSVKLLNLQSIC